MNETVPATAEQTRRIVVKAKTADQLVAERTRILEVMDAVMKQDRDFGTIPGTPKPTLYKSGSEKICSAFHISVRPIVEDLSDEDEIRYRVTCRGVHMETEIIVGEGVGEASTSEERYKWRAAVCDEEYMDTPDERRRIKYKKKYGGEVEKIFQIRTEPADLANTVLKMAKKRAQIDMTLTATAASEVFTQDLEDLPPGVDPNAADENRTGKPETDAPRARSGSSSGGNRGGSAQCTAKQVGLIEHRLGEAGVSQSAFCDHFEITAIAELPKARVDDALAWIKQAATG